MLHQVLLAIYFGAMETAACGADYMTLARLPHVEGEKRGLQWTFCQLGPGRRWRCLLVCARPVGLCVLAAHSHHYLEQISRSSFHNLHHSAKLCFGLFSKHKAYQMSNDLQAASGRCYLIQGPASMIMFLLIRRLGCCLALLHENCCEPGGEIAIPYTKPFWKRAKA